MSKLVPIDTLDLTEQEVESYNKYSGPPVAPVTAANFFTLFLEGYSLQEIHQRHKQWPFGALVDARIRYEWDKKKSEYVDKLHGQVIERMKKLKAESLNFLADMAAVVHTEFKEEMLQYLQDPKRENLPKNRIKSIREYKELISVFDQIGKLGQPIPEQTPVSISINNPDGKIEIIASDEKRASLLSGLAHFVRKNEEE